VNFEQAYQAVYRDLQSHLSNVHGANYSIGSIQEEVLRQYRKGTFLGGVDSGCLTSFALFFLAAIAAAGWLNSQSA